MKTSLVIIENINIRQDEEGRFCLNDLHKAAGGEAKDQPSNWLRLDQTKDLISEIDRCSDMSNHSSEMRTALNTIVGGSSPGTFVVKELVYAYAMWINPSFHLKVIRTFDAVVNRPKTQAEVLAGVAMALVDQERQLQVVSQKQDAQAVELQEMRNVVALNPIDWRRTTEQLLKQMAVKLGGFHFMQDLRSESYRLLDERMAVVLQIRLTNKRRRMADEGICKSKRDRLNALDVIGDDKKLVEGYVAIIKEMAIKYGVGQSAS